MRTWGPGPNLARYATARPSQTKGEAFEALACRMFGVPFALGVSSGTAALHSAFVAAGVGPDTEVICPGHRLLCHSRGRGAVEGGTRLL